MNRLKWCWGWCCWLPIKCLLDWLLNLIYGFSDLWGRLKFISRNFLRSIQWLGLKLWKALLLILNLTPNTAFVFLFKFLLWQTWLILLIHLRCLHVHTRFRLFRSFNLRRSKVRHWNTSLWLFFFYLSHWCQQLQSLRLRKNSGFLELIIALSLKRGQRGFAKITCRPILPRYWIHLIN